MSFTTDTWTSRTTESYVSITEHITDEWNIECYALCTRAMPESHTGVNLASNLKSVFNEFHLISKVEVCVHDNARNMVPFVRNGMILAVLVTHCKFV